MKSESRMANKEKEYISIVIITLFHGIYTYCALGKMPYISLGIFDRISIGAFAMWAIYSMCLYFITQKWIIQSDNMKKHYILSIVFGITAAFIKGCMDFGVGKLSDYLQSVIKMVYLDEATTVIFNVLLIYVLFVIVGKGKLQFKLKNVKVPLCMLIMLITSYGVFIGNYLWQNQAAIKLYGANKEEIFNLDYHFGKKILNGNVWFYIIFFLVFWWFMRRLTEKKEELIDAASLKRGDR